jgi:hypothetical protein
MTFVNEMVASKFADWKSRGLDDEGAMRLAMRWHAMMSGELSEAEYENTAAESLAKELER